MLGAVSSRRGSAARRASSLRTRNLLRQDSELELPVFDLVNRLPTLTPYVKDEVIHKKTPAGSFAPRRIVTTASDIYFCPEDSDEVLDDILLHEIVSVFQVRPLHQLMSSTVEKKKFSGSGSRKRMETEEEKRDRILQALSDPSKSRIPAVWKIDAVFAEYQRRLDGKLDAEEFAKACSCLHKLASDPHSDVFSGPPSIPPLNDAQLQGLSAISSISLRTHTIITVHHH